jgi:hypothetical protein
MLLVVYGLAHEDGQYDGKLDLSVDANIYDLDMFDTKAPVVSELYAMNRKVMCEQFTRYTDQKRLVVDVEYLANQQRFLTKICPSDAKYDETAILKKLDLTAWILTCSSRSAHRLGHGADGP